MYLFLPVKFIHDISLAVFVNQDVFGRGDEAVFDTAIAAEGILVSTRVKEAEVERFGVLLTDQGKINLAFVDFGVVVVGVVAT
jgi:hypothetical protein